MIFFRLEDINGHNNKKTATLLSQFLFKQTRRIEKASNGFSKKKKKKASNEYLIFIIIIIIFRNNIYVICKNAYQTR